MSRALISLAALACLTGCAKIPYIGPLLETKPVEHIEEEVVEEVLESTAKLAGTSAHVEVDIDPVNDPCCMHCSFHCPNEIVE